MVNGIQSKFEAIGNTELIENVVQVILDCLLADKELFADFFVAVALRDQLNDLLLPIAEQRFFAARPSLSGMRRSRRRISGLSLASILMQSFPLEASPTIVISSSPSRSLRRPSRKMA